MSKTKLGMGLSSLIPNKLSSKKKENYNLLNKNETENSNKVFEISVDNILPNPSQPRIYFDKEELEGLSKSIKEHGIIQPILVTKAKNDRYELVAGERRVQAAKLSGLKKVPAILTSAENMQKLELALVENVQRHNLNSIEEARAYKKLQEEFGLTQDDISKKTGKDRSTISNTIRLLDLPVEIQRGIIENKITEGHGRAILRIENQEKQRALYELTIKNKLTVRDVENKIKEVIVKVHKRRIFKHQDLYIKSFEEKIEQKLGTKVSIVKRKKHSGKIIIDFYSKEEFEKIIGFIS